MYVVGRSTAAGCEEERLHGGMLLVLEDANRVLATAPLSRLCSVTGVRLLVMVSCTVSLNCVVVGVENGKCGSSLTIPRVLRVEITLLLFSLHSRGRI